MDFLTHPVLIAQSYHGLVSAFLAVELICSYILDIRTRNELFDRRITQQCKSITRTENAASPF